MGGQQPLWARILQAYYEQDMAGESFDKYGYSKLARVIHIAEFLNANQSDVHRSLNRLIDMGLLNDLPTGNRKQGFSLTKEGFQVAHERSMRTTQNNVNRILGYLTVGLLLISSLSALVSAAVNIGNTRSFLVGFDIWPLIIAAVSIGLAIVLSYHAYSSGVLSVDTS